jgi:hypothetical protein
VRRNLRYATFRTVRSGTAHLELVIDVDSDPISGSVSNGAQHSRPFSGWIELVAAIEDARSANHGGGGSEPHGQAGVKTLGYVPGAKAAEL